MRRAPAAPAGNRRDLSKDAHYRYRCTGLRLLVERDHVHHPLPLSWRKDIDPTHVIKGNDSIRIELRPGTQPGI